MKPEPEHRPRHRRNGSCPRIGGPTATLPPTTAREAMEDTEQPHLQPLPAGVEEQSMVAKSVSSSIPTFNSKLLTYAKQRATNMLLRRREAATSVLPPPPRPTAMLPEPPIPIPTAIHAPTTALVAMHIACNALNRTPHRRSICAPRTATKPPLAGHHTMNRQLGIGIGPRHPPHHPPHKVQRRHRFRRELQAVPPRHSHLSHLPAIRVRIPAERLADFPPRRRRATQVR